MRKMLNVTVKSNRYKVKIKNIHLIKSIYFFCFAMIQMMVIAMSIG